MPLKGVPVFKVVINYGDGAPQVKLIQAPSRTAARQLILKVISVTRATQQDMLLALGPEAIPIEHEEASTTSVWDKAMPAPDFINKGDVEAETV